MIIGLYGGLLLITLILAKNALISPFIAGGAGLTFCAYFNLDYNACLFVIISLYFAAYLTNTWAEVQGCSMTMSSMVSNSSNHEDDVNMLPLIAIKLCVLLLFLALPIGKPPLYLSGWLGLIIIGCVLYMNRSSYSSAKSFILSTIVMLIGFCAVFGLFNRFGSGNSSMTLIAAVAVPNLLFPSKEEEYFHGNEGGFPTILWSLTLFYVWITPGFSMAAASPLFPLGFGRIVCTAMLEAALEGWVVHLVLTEQLSTKTPLGDLLSSSALELTTFTLSPHSKLLIVSAVLIGCLSVVAAILMPSIGNSPSPMLSAIVLVTQSVIASNLLWTIAFICVGLIVQRLTEKDPEVMAMSYIAPTLL